MSLSAAHQENLMKSFEAPAEFAKLIAFLIIDELSFLNEQ